MPDWNRHKLSILKFRVDEILKLCLMLLLYGREYLRARLGLCGARPFEVRAG